MCPKELCTIDFLDDLIETGVEVLKIEGRGKSADYVRTSVKCYREAIDAYYEGEYTRDKVTSWLKQLETVFNRGFWGGYFLGKPLGEWTDSSGSKATQKKIFLGKGLHYFKKAGIGHFKIVSEKLNVGDHILVTGPTTGAKEMQVQYIQVNGKSVDTVIKGSECTFATNFPVRVSDKLYKIEKNNGDHHASKE